MKKLIALLVLIAFPSICLAAWVPNAYDTTNTGVVDLHVYSLNVLTNGAGGNGLYWGWMGESNNILPGHFGMPGGAFILGGTGNTIIGDSIDNPYTTIVGGKGNSIANSLGSVIGGGLLNVITNKGSSRPFYSVIAGGYNNLIRGTNVAGDLSAVISGGNNNQSLSDASTVGGGEGNIASGAGSVVAGGAANYASGYSGTASGGYSNLAAGVSSVVPGGDGNSAIGNYSFAAGLLATATNQGSFVWSDSLGGEIDTARDQFRASAHGGFFFDNGPLTASNATFLGTSTAATVNATNVNVTGSFNINGSPVLTNVLAAQISPAGGTAGQILLNTGTGTVWTNDQSIVQAGSYEFVTSTTNLVTGQIIYTVTGVNTNQFLGAGPGGYKDASSVTNTLIGNVNMGTVQAVVTNMVAGKVPWSTNGSIIHYFIDYTNAP